MIGIFDSGVGGLNAFYEVRRGLPYADIAYLADRANAPYGTKPKDELISLVKNDIKRLRELGCRLILIACCTASTVYPELSDDEKILVALSGGADSSALLDMVVRFVGSPERVFAAHVDHLI